MILKEVKSKEDAQEFLDMAVHIYVNDPNWVRPLDKDITAIFDPNRNKKFTNGKAIRYLLIHESGKTVGRIAAFFENSESETIEKIGGAGFFECINDHEAARILFDGAAEWLKSNGFAGMDGPINFGERNNWWGCLVDGFTMPVYGMIYNPPYYRDLFEQYGFRTYFEQYCFSQNTKAQLSEILLRKADRITADPSYSCKRMRVKNLENHAGEVADIYNQAWGKYEEGVRSVTKESIYKLFKKLKPIIEEDLTWIAYHHDRPIGFWLNLPDINYIIRHFNGKMNWWNKIRFYVMLKTGYCKRFFGIVFGVVEDYQRKGIDSFMIKTGAKVIQSKGNYDELELTWIGDFNPRMLRVADSLGASRNRTLITYRKFFDSEHPFERCPIQN